MDLCLLLLTFNSSKTTSEQIKHKLTVRCCFQWPAWPTDRSKDRRDVWRTEERHRTAEVTGFLHMLFCICRMLILLIYILLSEVTKFITSEVTTFMWSMWVSQRTATIISVLLYVHLMKECWMRCHCAPLPISFTKSHICQLFSPQFWPLWYFCNVPTSLLFYHCN